MTFNCTATTVICPSPGGEEGSCIIKYTEDENYQQLSLPHNTSFNSRTELQLEGDTRYFFQITIVVSNMTFILRKTFATGSSKYIQLLLWYLSSVHAQRVIAVYLFHTTGAFQGRN